MNKLLIIPCILSPLFLHPQTADNFSDGDFTSNPSWTGDGADFKVNTAQQLQLNATGEGISSLSAEMSLSDTTEWHFWVKLSFAPSDNNLARIYLVSDSQDLENGLNGYYLKLGESGSNDAIELVKQAGNVHTSLGRGQAGLISGSFTLRIKALLYPGGNWQVLADASGGQNYSLQLQATDNTFPYSSRFGVYCKYTSSNSNKFYFDDIYAGPVVLDKEPPVLLGAKAVSATGVDVRFSESMDAVSAVDCLHYEADRGLGNPASALQDFSDPALVHLEFTGTIQPDVHYRLTVRQLGDLSGNILVQSSADFAWHRVRAFDILVNEIMADPSPAVYLPEWEYIELYNRCDFPIDLQGWKIIIGNSVKEFTDVQMDAKACLILADEDALQELNTFGPLAGFSGFSVTNSGGTVTLLDPEGHMIHSISYTDEWYRSDYKQEGGWSLEMIDPVNPCGEASNWMASNDPSGGTPGRANQAGASNPDRVSPVIERVGIENPLEITVWFNESVDSTGLLQTENYWIDNGIGNPLAVIPAAPKYDHVTLSLSNALQAGVMYSLNMTGTVTDCAGNAIMSGDPEKFAIPDKPGMNELVINEILSDPLEGGVDFIEIFNPTQKVFDLRDLFIANYDTLFQSFSGISEISAVSCLMLPGDFMVLSTDSSAIKRFYATPNPGGFINLEHFPVMGNEEGSVALALKTGEITDQVVYTSALHYPLLTSFDGVSLERINPMQPSQDKTNWHSASGTAGYATPAYKNSQFGQLSTVEGGITLSPPVFTPDNDGSDDYLAIGYEFDHPGFSATVRIFDASGNPVRTIVNNQLAGISGAFTWDGITDDNLKAPVGRYIVLVKAFDPEGNVIQYRKTTVLGAYLK